MRKKRIRTKIEITLEVIPFLALVVSLYLQLFTLSSLGFSLLLKRLQKFPFLGFKRRYLYASWWLRFFQSRGEHVSFLKQEIGQALRHLAFVLYPGSYLPVVGCCSTQPRVHILIFFSLFQKYHFLLLFLHFLHSNTF